MFRRLKVDINAKDYRGSTPLHWACYSHSEIALTYLLAWEPNLNLQDHEGQTPLHLAVRSVETMQTTRLVRFVMLRGAERDIKDKNGKIPIELTNTVTEDNLRQELERMLGPPGKLECLMLTPPIRLTHQNSCTMITYICIFVFSHAILLLMVYCRLPWYLGLTEFVLGVFCLLFLTLSSCI